MHIGCHIGVLFRPGLHDRYPEIMAHLLHFHLLSSGRCGHGKEKGRAGRFTVHRRDEHVCIISHGAMTLIDDQEGDIGKRVGAREEIVFDHLGGGKDECGLRVRLPPFIGRAFPGKEGAFRLFPVYKQVSAKETVVLLHQGFCGCQHQHFSFLIVETGSSNDQGNRGLSKTCREDHHGIAVKRPHRDRELVGAGFKGPGTDERVGDPFHGIRGSTKPAVPSISDRIRSGIPSIPILTCRMLSRSLNVTVLSSLVS